MHPLLLLSRNLCRCSFDDSSSISSGDISDAINEISTDENQTGSSRSGTSSDRTNPYASLKRAPTTAGAPAVPAQGGFATRSLPTRSNTGFAARNGGAPRHLNGGVRDSVDSLIRAGPMGVANGVDSFGYARKPPTGGSTCIAFEDPHITNLTDPSQGQHQTNADHLKSKMAPGAGSFGFRRSNAAPGACRSATSGMDASKGERISNYNGNATGTPRPNVLGSRTVSGTQTMTGHTRDTSGSESTLERKRRANLVSSNTQTVLTGLPGSTPEDGARGSRVCSSNHGSLNRDGTFGGMMSTPGAFSRMDVMRHSFNHPGCSGDAGGHLSSFLSPEFAPSRPLSALSSPTTNGVSWLKSGTPHANGGLRSTMSESESMESVYSMSSSIQVYYLY